MRRRRAASGPRWALAAATALGLLAGRSAASAPTGAPPATDASAADALAEAETLARDGRLAEAAASYTRALERGPDHREALLGRARVRGWLGDRAGALADLERVLAAHPEDREARVQRARVLGWMRRFAEAERELGELLARDPEDVEAQLTLGDLLGWQGRLEESARRYQAAGAAAPRDPRPWVALGRTRFWLGDRSAAREAYERALRLAPDDEEALQGLRRASAPRERRARLEVGVRYDALAGDGDWQQVWGRLGVRVLRQAGLVVGLDHHRRFGAREVQATLGGELGLPTRGSLSASVSLGPGAEVVARRAFDVELAQPVGGSCVALLRYRHADLAGGIRVDLVSPGIEFGAGPFARLRVRYTHAFVSRDARGRSGSAQLALFPESPLGLRLGAAYGTEGFAEARLPHLPAQGRLRSLSGGLTWRVREGIGLGFGYEYEDVAHAYARHGISSGVSVSF